MNIKEALTSVRPKFRWFCSTFIDFESGWATRKVPVRWDDLTDVKGKSTGTLLPPCEFKLDKNKQIDIALNQNPWKLVDVLDWEHK